MRRTILCFFTLLLSHYAMAQCMRGTIVNNYNNIYLNTAVSGTDLGWTGDVTTCNRGTISDTAMNRSLRRINYLRELTGVPTSVIYDTTLSRKAQEAALMMDANNTLDHNPPSSWLCYTADGDDAAGSSNLSLGSHSSGAISAFMNDNGTGNSAAGHRRWILYSRATTFGMGSTSGSCALWVIGNSGPAPTIDFVAYPSDGFFPAALVPSSNRWSFSKPQANMDNATVVMTDGNGANVPVTLETVENGYGDNTLVWQATGINTAGPFDEKYTVTVSNVVVSGSPQDFTYDVILVQPVHPPACPTGFAWSEPDCMCIAGTGVDELAHLNGLKVISNPFADQLKLQLINKDIREIQIVNISSGLIDKKTISGSEDIIEFNTAGWAAGIYFVTHKNNDGRLGQIRVAKIK